MRTIFISFMLIVIFLLTYSGIKNNHQKKNMIAMFLVLVVSYYATGPFYGLHDGSIVIRLIISFDAGLAYFIVGMQTERYLKGKGILTY